jgi:hypothetical protein
MEDKRYENFPRGKWVATHGNCDLFIQDPICRIGCTNTLKGRYLCDIHVVKLIQYQERKRNPKLKKKYS